MAIHKLQFDDFVSVDYELVAIHSSLEDYRLAYFLNQTLDILLEKCNKDVSLKSSGGESRFARFIFEDEASDTVWNLFRNKSEESSSVYHDGLLFAEEAINATAYLLPEYKKTDYILKVENTPSFFALENVTGRLQDLRYISTAYRIDHNKLKSKNNLIF